MTRPTDARGWCVPTPGTTRRAVYDLLDENERRRVEGLPLLSCAEIAKLTGARSVNAVRVTTYNVRHPLAKRRHSADWAKRHPGYYREKSSRWKRRQDPHVLKLARVLRVPIAEARRLAAESDPL